MPTTIITAEGRVTVPKIVRETLHVKLGDQIEFVQISEDRYEIVAV